jgi:hypothetical protein
MTSQDEFLPVYHFSEVHSIRIDAERDAIAGVINVFDFRESPVIRFLFSLRGLPRNTAAGLDGVKKMGFVVLRHQEQREIVLGLIGQFWKRKGKIQSCSPQEFRVFDNPDFAKATWSFKIIGDQPPYVVETETRIACHAPATRKKFSRYWFFIRPFSGWIRMEMLRAIRKKASKKSHVID